MPRKLGPAMKMFAASGADDVYKAIVSRLQKRVGADGAVVDPKGTCVHINAGKGGVAYAGLHPRKGGVLMTIRTQSPLKSPRIRKAEQASRNRCHCDLLISSVAEVDDELLGWLEEAAQLVLAKSRSGAR